MGKDTRRLWKGVERGRSFEIEVDGEKLPAYEGETIATVLLAAGKATLRKTAKHGRPRGIYCGVGTCFECRMIVNGKPNVQVCRTPATPNCIVQTQIGLEHGEDVS
jgi:hypothetical protein